MTAPATRVLSTLTRRHAIKVVFASSIEVICLAIGEVVGHGCILSASRMNGATVVFLSGVEKVNEVVEKGIVIDGEFVSVLPLSMPSKRVTLSNVPPFLSDEILTKALARYGKLVSPIKKIPISATSPLLKHIVSFRRFAYMIVQDDEELDLSLSFRVDDFDYVIFVSTAKTTCFRCKKTGHLIRNCPEKGDTEKGDDSSHPSTSKAGVDLRSAGAQGGSSSKAEVVICDETPRIADDVVTVMDSEKGGQNDMAETAVPDKTYSKLPEKERECGNTGKDDTQVVLKRSETDYVDLDMETEAESFKMPQKRKMSDKSQNKKALKKLVLNSSDDNETDSESEFSDSSVALSLSEFSVRSYNAEEIKTFLKSTKNKRGVCVQEYFPNLTQFVEKTKGLMAEGCFTNKEVYRLKKIVRNLEKIKNDV